MAWFQIQQASRMLWRMRVVSAPEHRPGDYANLCEKFKDAVWLGLRPESNEVYVDC